MTDDLRLTDIQGGTKLEAESLDEDDVDSVHLTIKPGQRGVPSQAISLYEDAEEDLATWLLRDLVDEESASVALTPEDHRVLSDLGISRREDGAWGYKLSCANRRCPNNAQTCYCADGLLEAVRDAASRRSDHPCGVLCWFAAGTGFDYLYDYPELDPESWIEDAIGLTGVGLWMQLHPGADRDAVAESKDVFDAIEALTEAWRQRNEDIQELREKVEEELKDAFQEIRDPGEFDYTPDMNECACPTGGGGGG